MDIKEFLYRNKLKQVDLARYLGVTEAFISRMAKGVGNPSKENLNKILDNPYGWDTTMLVDNGGIYAGNNNGGSVNVKIDQNRSGGDNNPSSRDANTQIAVLEKENQMLREQIEFMKSLIPSQQKQ